MEIFREVQARMLQPGGMGNRSCFSGHVQCGSCGSTYERSTRRCGKNSGQAYTIWICRSKRKHGAACCGAKSIPEHILESLSGEVLQLSSFNPQIFAAEIETIVVVGCDKLIFYFKNGSVLQRQWHSTARTDCWNARRREQFSRQCQGINRNPHTQNPFTGLIRCPHCGQSAVRQLRHYKDDTSAAFWHCRTKGCGNATKIWEDTLKDMVRDVPRLPYSVQYMELVDTRTVKICYTDGHCEAKSFQQTRKMRTRKADGRN